MKIAVTYKDGEIFQHFGHCEQFKIYEIENNQVIKSEIIDANGSGHGALAGMLASHKVNLLVCGGIGAGAQMALFEAGILLYGGISGYADDAVNAYLAGKLSHNPNVRCTHHDHEDGHSCGSHDCGSHSCH